MNHQELVTKGFNALGIHFNAVREEVANLEKYGFAKVWCEILKVSTWSKHKTLKLIGLYLMSSVLHGWAYEPIVHYQKSLEEHHVLIKARDGYPGWAQTV
jgi:hypothetical protein